MTKEQFKKLHKTAWLKPHNFVVIDLTSQKNCGKYRSGFDNFYIIEQMSDTKLLEKIVQNTELKTSTQIVVSESSTKIKTTFNPPLELDRTRKYEMALVNLETYYSFPNLSDENNVFRYSPGFVEISGIGDGDDSTRQRQWVEVQIPEGSYDLIDLAETIIIVMKRNGGNDESIKITANTNTLKSVLEIQGDFQVDFRVRNSISSVLGFQNQVYKEGIHESQNVVNILSINSILVNVDVIGGSYVNGRTQNTIYSFFPKVSPGYKIVENLRNLVYLPVILDKINKMETVVTDQNGNQLNLRGENLTIRYHLREI